MQLLAFTYIQLASRQYSDFLVTQKYFGSHTHLLTICNHLNLIHGKAGRLRRPVRAPGPIKQVEKDCCE